ncbi:MAG: pyridoxamine 5'-phosphate oxidase family protein [Rhizomicrobium sp.]
MTSAAQDRDALLAYMRSHKLAVVGSLGPDGAPQAALVGIAVTDDLQVVFDTVSTSRKHGNLLRDGRASVTFSGPGEQTLQMEGNATPVSMTDAGNAVYLSAYYAAWPDGRDRAKWPKIAYWRIAPKWMRYSDYARGPVIEEFRFDQNN